MLNETVNKKVLICTSVGAHGPAVNHDLALAKAFLEKGVNVEFLLCDGVLPACEACNIYVIDEPEMIKFGPKKHCSECFSNGYSSFKHLAIPINKYSTFLDPTDQPFADQVVSKLKESDYKTLAIDGIDVGEDAYAGALRYFAVGDLGEEKNGMIILKRYLRASVVALKVIQRAFDSIKPDFAIFHHGIYVPQGVMGKIARQKGISVVNWSVGYRKNTFIYSHNDTYHKTMIDEPENLWKDFKLSKNQESTLDEYLESRISSKKDWIKFNDEPVEDLDVIKKELNLDARPIIVLLTNVTWDAQLFYKNNAFPSIIDWLEFTINYFKNRKDLQLVVRVHPAEIRGTMATRQPILQVMRNRIKEFPDNVFLVDAASKISTYSLATLADSTIIYGTKTGVELAARGFTVIVVGEAWIRNKGLTIDISSLPEYTRILDRLPLSQRSDDQKIMFSKQYAYHYFFRRLIPINVFTYTEKKKGAMERIRNRVLGIFKRNSVVVKSPYRINLSTLPTQSLLSDKGLSSVCRNVLEKKEFIFEE